MYKLDMFGISLRRLVDDAPVRIHASHLKMIYYTHPSVYAAGGKMKTPTRSTSQFQIYLSRRV